MATRFDSVEIMGYSAPGAGDAIASVIITAADFQGGSAERDQFINAVTSLVAAATNVTATVATKYERLSTVI